MISFAARSNSRRSPGERLAFSGSVELPGDAAVTPNLLSGGNLQTRREAAAAEARPGLPTARLPA